VYKEETDMSQDETTAALQPGFWVVLTLRPGMAPLRSYAGRIEAIDKYGIRLTEAPSWKDWSDKNPSGNGVFVPWNSLTSAFVVPPDQSPLLSHDAAESWQTSMAQDDVDDG
jgi:hypothetical protein